MAEIDLAAKRHAIAGWKGQGSGDGGLLGDGRDSDAEDATDHAEKQVNKANGVPPCSFSRNNCFHRKMSIGWPRW